MVRGTNVGGRSGHGLGLSIVKRIVERLRGQVGVDSIPGAGSRFYFTLPAAE
jgi:signal transduction histidine kinase